jgi:hypothetical protein
MLGAVRALVIFPCPGYHDRFTDTPLAAAGAGPRLHLISYQVADRHAAALSRAALLTAGPAVLMY